MKRRPLIWLDPKKCHLGLAVSLLLLLNFSTVWGVVDTLRPVADVCTETGGWNCDPGDPQWKCIINSVDTENPDSFLTEVTIALNYQWRNADWSGSGTIDSVVGFFVLKSDMTAQDLTMRISRGWYSELICTDCGWRLLNDYDDLTNVYQTFSVSFATDPCDGGAWTSTKINNDNRGWGVVIIQQSIPVSTISFDQSWVVVYSHIPPAGNPRRRRIIISENSTIEDIFPVMLTHRDFWMVKP